MLKKIILAIVLVIIIGFILIRIIPKPIQQSGFEIEILVENLNTP